MKIEPLRCINVIQMVIRIIRMVLIGPGGIRKIACFVRLWIGINSRIISHEGIRIAFPSSFVLFIIADAIHMNLKIIVIIYLKLSAGKLFLGLSLRRGWRVRCDYIRFFFEKSRGKTIFKQHFYQISSIEWIFNRYCRPYKW